MGAVPRAATTSDAFNAVAEPRRREILDFLSLAERPVGDIVDSLNLEQPSVSKHLRVLRETGLVNARRDGRRMLYRTNAEAIRPLYERTSTFERFWRHQLSRIKGRDEERQKPHPMVWVRHHDRYESNYFADTAESGKPAAAAHNCCSSHS